MHEVCMHAMQGHSQPLQQRHPPVTPTGQTGPAGRLSATELGMGENFASSRATMPWQHHVCSCSVSPRAHHDHHASVSPHAWLSWPSMYILSSLPYAIPYHAGPFAPTLAPRTAFNKWCHPRARMTDGLKRLQRLVMASSHWHLNQM